MPELRIRDIDPKTLKRLRALAVEHDTTPPKLGAWIIEQWITAQIPLTKTSPLSPNGADPSDGDPTDLPVARQTGEDRIPF